MAEKRMAINLKMMLGSRLTSALQFGASRSVYPQCMEELTVAQTLVLSAFHSLLIDDIQFLLVVVAMSHDIPQLSSTYIKVWLRDDFRFYQEEVAMVLATLSRLVSEGVIAIPMPIVIALSSLEEKYDIFTFFHNSQDKTAQVLLALLNPLVSRATQVGPEDIGFLADSRRISVRSCSTQTDVGDFAEENSADIRESSSSLSEEESERNFDISRPSTSTTSNVFSPSSQAHQAPVLTTTSIRAEIERLTSNAISSYVKSPLRRIANQGLAAEVGLAGPSSGFVPYAAKLPLRRIVERDISAETQLAGSYFNRIYPDLGPIINALGDMEIALEEESALSSSNAQSNGIESQRNQTPERDQMTRYDTPYTLLNMQDQASPINSSVETPSTSKTRRKSKKGSKSSQSPPTSKAQQHEPRPETAPETTVSDWRRQNQHRLRIGPRFFQSRTFGQNQDKHGDRSVPNAHGVTARRGDPVSAIQDFLQSEEIDQLIKILKATKSIIHAVAFNGRTDLLTDCLGVDNPDTPNEHGLSPLQTAMYSSNNSATIHLLLSFRAKLEYRDPRGWTALHHAAYHGTSRMTSLLLSYGSNREAKTYAGYRPLHIAAMFNHTEVVRILVRVRAFKKVRDPHGLKPIHWAYHYNNNEMMLLLKS